MHRVFVSSLVCCLISASWAKENHPAYTDPAKAGPDFKIQGEYVGVVEADDNTKWGAQVIALGDGKFESVGYRGGLPGDGWKRGDTVNRIKGEMKDGAAVFESEDVVLRVKEGVMSVESTVGDKFGELKKVERKSPTLGAKPPQGAIILFDGKGLEKWENGKLVEGKLLGATNPQSKPTFGDHQLHLEFRTPFMPKSRGQARGNSGMYVQSRYEVQVLDSFGLEGKDNECGGIYSINKPIVNMCLPPLSWQTYDVEFTAARCDAQGNKTKNARITVKHNGVVIHDDQELKHGTPGRYAEGPQKQGLYLQDHGNPVVFRNIWVMEK